MRIIAKSKEEKKILCYCIVVFIIFVALDQLTKYLIVADKELIYHPIAVISGFFNIVSVRNTGAAWGMFYGNNTILFGIAIVAFIVLVLFFRSLTEGCIERYYALALVLSGIIGNSIDRLTRKSVVDFLDFHVGQYHWPAFNVADSAICVGVCVLILSFLFRKPS